MKYYALRKSRHKFHKDEEKKKRRSWLIWACGVVYLLIVTGATVYSQIAYVQRLPEVTLCHVEDGLIPDTALVETAEGLMLYYVEQSDGPWGKQYVLGEMQIHMSKAMGNGMTYVFEASTLEYPVVSSSSIPMESAYDGMVVHIR